MADIFRDALKKRMAEAEEGDHAKVPTKIEGPINADKKSMTQYEFGKAGKEDPRKKDKK